MAAEEPQSEQNGEGRKVMRAPIGWRMCYSELQTKGRFLTYWAECLACNGDVIGGKHRKVCNISLLTAEWAILHGNCRTEQEKRLGLRPRFEILKQRADEYFPLNKLEKPHLRWAAGYPEGPIIPGQSDREAYPGYKRYQARIHADTDSMRFWGSVMMMERHNYCLPPEQQKIYDSGKKVEVTPPKERHEAHSVAYRLDEERYLAEALQRLQAGAGQEPAVGDASGSLDMAAADGNKQARAAKRRRALPGKTTQGSAKKQRVASTKKAAAHPVQKVSAHAQPAAVVITAEPAEAAPAHMPRRPARGKVGAASPQLPATGTAAAPATPAQRDSLLNGAHGRSSSRPARRSANAQQPASAFKDAAGPMPSVIAATSAAEARPAGGTAQGAAAAELAELRSLLQQREAECRQVAEQNITLQMKVDELHGALAAVRQRSEEDMQVLRYMEPNIATLHARLDKYMHARHQNLSSRAVRL